MLVCACVYVYDTTELPPLSSEQFMPASVIAGGQPAQYRDTTANYRVDIAEATKNSFHKTANHTTHTCMPGCVSTSISMHAFECDLGITNNRHK